MADPTTGNIDTIDYCCDCKKFKNEWDYGLIFHLTHFHWRYRDHEHLWGIREYTYRGPRIRDSTPRTRSGRQRSEGTVIYSSGHYSGIG